MIKIGSQDMSIDLPNFTYEHRLDFYLRFIVCTSCPTNMPSKTKKDNGNVVAIASKWKAITLRILNEHEQTDK